MATYFISDLHLEPGRPQVTRAFLHFLRHTATDAEAIYILGDFFEVWIGDDEDLPLHREVAAALKERAGHGVRIAFVPGNRDFLVGQRYCRAAGMTLLPDPTLIDLYGAAVVLAHGDGLCTQDTGYQRYRRIIRSRLIHRLHRRLPLSLRRRIGRALRGHSDEVNRYKSRMLMDIDPAAAQELLARSGAGLLIHGHTHRPGRHEAPARIVLGDWDEQGWYLRCTPDGTKELISFPIGNPGAA